MVSDNPVRLGILTSYNQRCGLATYAKSFVSEMPQDRVTILAEDVGSEELFSADEPNVRRCWKRNEKDFSKVEAIIADENIKVLHLNVQYRYFEPENLTPFLNRIKARGVKVIAHLHSTYSLEPSLAALVISADHIIVHSLENKLEAIANGAQAANVSVIEHGCGTIKHRSKQEVRSALGIPQEQQVVVCFGFIQAHKGIKETIQAMQPLRAAMPNLHLYVVGSPHKSDASAQSHFSLLKDLVREYALGDRVHFSDGYVSEEQVQQYLMAADAVVMHYISCYHESSGAVAQALACHAPVITSWVPTFNRLGDTVFHTSAGYPLALAIPLVVNDPKLNGYLRERAAAWAAKHSWANIAKELSVLYAKLSNGELDLSKAVEQISVGATSVQQKSYDIGGAKSGKLRVLMQNRSNALMQRGGDTVVMEEVARGLRELGIKVDIDVEHRCNPADYDLVHLHNFATPDITRALAERCVQAKVPYVVTTMYEDLPIFYNQMQGLFQILEAYLQANQPKDRWPEYIKALRNVPPSPRWENAWTAQHATGLIASGNREKETLLRDYPNAKYVDTYRLGCEVSQFSDDGSLFVKETGIKDFVLCVGRLETRKNQLMLLKAMEESELEVVFATGGFTYQPEYEKACRVFKRAGKTHFLGRLSPELLSSAYAAARVHALPSWYELPGIVSMEAARRKTNIVVSDRGTAKDYFGDKAFYCEPDNAESIYSAVVSAYYAPARKGLEDTVKECTWRTAAMDVLGIYEQALGLKVEACTCSSAVPTVSLEPTPLVAKKAMSPEQAEALCVEAEGFVRGGNSLQAEEAYKKVLNSAPDSTRALRGLGVIAIQKQEFQKAKDYFSEALKVDPIDVRVLTGLGASMWGLGEKDEAFRSYMEAIALNPDSLTTIYYLIDASYALNKLDTLEAVLGRYVQRNPNNVSIKYCLAGCLYREGKYDQSLNLAQEMLKVAPDNKDAIELIQLIEKAKHGVVAPTEEFVAFRPETKPVTVAPVEDVAKQIQALEGAKEQKDYKAAIAKAEDIERSSYATDDQKIYAKIIKAESLACIGEVHVAESLFEPLNRDHRYRHRVLTGLGAIEASRTNWTKAEMMFKEALRLMPRYDVALVGLGFCAVGVGETTAAWGYFTEANSVQPENIHALFGIIQVGYSLNKVGEIEQYISRYLEAHPANISMLYAHAGACYAQGKRGQAKADLDKIFIFDPNNQLAKELAERMNKEAV